MKKNESIVKPYVKQFYYKNKFSLVVAMIATVLISGTNLAISWVFQQVLDVASGSGGAFSLITLVWITLGLIAGIAFIGFLLYNSQPKFTARAVRRYKDYAFSQIMKKGIAAFNGENTTTYISALSNDVKSIEGNYLTNLFPLVTQITVFVGAFTMMLLYSRILTLVAVVLSLLPVVASVISGSRLVVAEKKVSDRNEGYLATLKDSLSGFSVIKSFKAEKQMIGLLANVNERLAKASCKRDKINIFVQMVGAVAGASAQLGVFLFGAYLVIYKHSITPGVVLVFTNLMNFVIEPIAQVPGLLAKRKSALGLVEKLANAVNTNVSDEGKEVPKYLEKAIEVKDLSFGYESDKTILHDINCSFCSGKSYAIVGASGSGKSTLLSLLMAGHNSYTGSIMFDDTELRNISSESLYEVISIIQQNVFIFNSSIRNNITMFSEFDKADVDDAIIKSGLGKLIEERGEQYECGENGAGLSGGEKQRISIARTLLRKTPVLLVDEATAALDAETAHHVSNSILNLDSLTRIVVTHTLDETLLTRYDCILTLKDGRIIETGTFDELMQSKGYFYSLFTISQ